MTRRTMKWLPLLLAMLMFATIVVSACTKTATVTYVSGVDDATGNAPASKTVAIGEDITLEANPFTRTGYTFTGWSDGSNTYQPGDSYTVNGNTTFTAQWKLDEPAEQDERTYFLAGDPINWEKTAENTFTKVADHSYKLEGVALREGNKVKLRFNADKWNDESVQYSYGAYFFPESVFGASTAWDDDAVVQAGKDGIYNIALTTQGALTATTGRDAGQIVSFTFTRTGDIPVETPETDITGPINAFIKSTGTYSGELYLYSNGAGSIYVPGFAESEFTYTLSNGVISIKANSEQKIYASTGTVVGRTISITVTVGNSGSSTETTDYTFESTLAKLTTINMYGENETYVNFYPVGTPLNLTDVKLDDHSLKEVVVNDETKQPSYLESITALNDDTSIKFVWEELPKYTVTYQAGEGTGADYVVTTTNTSHKLVNFATAGFTAPANKSFKCWLIDGTEYAPNATISLTDQGVTVVAQWQSNITVTIEGIDNGCTTNITTDNGWTSLGSGAYSKVFTPSEASRFYLPYASSQGFGLLYVSKSGFTLTWQCSLHSGETHNPGDNHAITQDVTITAVWTSSAADKTLDDYQGTWEGWLTDADNDDWDMIKIEGNSISIRDNYFGDSGWEACRSVQTSMVGGKLVVTFSWNGHTGKITFESDSTMTLEVTPGGGYSAKSATFTKKS